MWWLIGFVGFTVVLLIFMTLGSTKKSNERINRLNQKKLDDAYENERINKERLKGIYEEMRKGGD